eukprot:1350893-Amphidinium_carterae.1
MSGMGPVLGSCLLIKLSSALRSLTEPRYSSSDMGSLVYMVCRAHESFLLMWSRRRALVPCSAPHAVHVVPRTLKARGGTTPCWRILWTMSPFVALKKRSHKGQGMVPCSSSGCTGSGACSSWPS